MDTGNGNTSPSLSHFWDDPVRPENTKKNHSVIK